MFERPAGVRGGQPEAAGLYRTSAPHQRALGR